MSADADDEVAPSCEPGNVRQSGVCVAARSDVRIGRDGRIGVRVSCAFGAKGTLELRSVGRVRIGKDRLRRLKLGSRGFEARFGRVQTVSVRASRAARKAIRRNGRMKVQVVLRSRREAAGAARRTSKRVITVRAPR